MGLQNGARFDQGALDQRQPVDEALQQVDAPLEQEQVPIRQQRQIARLEGAQGRKAQLRPFAAAADPTEAVVIFCQA